MLKIRRPLGRLIFNMGIAIPGKTVFLIETAPSQHQTITWTNAYLMSIEPIGTNIGEIIIKLLRFSLKKYIWKCGLQSDSVCLSLNFLVLRNFSVHENHRTCRTFPMARPKCLMRDFTNLNRICKAHQANVWWTLKVFRLHWNFCLFAVILHITGQWRVHDLDHTVNLQRTPHTSP